MPQILITGSGRRLGKSLAINFAKDGWDIILHYNESKLQAEHTYKEIINLGVKCDILSCDLRDSEAITSIFEDYFSNHRVPDVLVNNSGIFPEKRKVEDIDKLLWDNVLDLNLNAAFWLSQVYTKHKVNNGRIINMVSLGAFEVWDKRTSYNVSKAALMQLTHSLARELAPNFTVNSVCPGYIEIPDEPASDSSGIPMSKIPMGRYGNTQDIFDAVRFFATCSTFITGQNLNVDGGYKIAR